MKTWPTCFPFPKHQGRSTLIVTTSFPGGHGKAISISSPWNPQSFLRPGVTYEDQTHVPSKPSKPAFPYNGKTQCPFWSFSSNSHKTTAHRKWQSQGSFSHSLVQCLLSSSIKWAGRLVKTQVARPTLRGFGAGSLLWGQRTCKGCMLAADVGPAFQGTSVFSNQTVPQVQNLRFNEVKWLLKVKQQIEISHD